MARMAVEGPADLHKSAMDETVLLSICQRLVSAVERSSTCNWE
jgi:hypothetical protein